MARVERRTHTLVDALFLEAFRNPILDAMEDQAAFNVGGARLAFTTDSFVVSPLFFPGGNIGDLAVNGTVNDLAVGGARPLYLSAGFILEEGFPVADLQRIADSILVSGPIGDHGVTIMLARGELDIESDIESDTAPLAELINVLLDATTGVRVMRDATRGGVATILNEVARASNVAIVVDERAVPTREEVRGASEILGI